MIDMILDDDDAMKPLHVQNLDSCDVESISGCFLCVLSHDCDGGISLDASEQSLNRLLSSQLL
eukprot:173952-Hanusia_phi.AAC.1